MRLALFELITLVALSVSGCNSFFYWPDARAYRSTDDVTATVEEVSFESRDGTRLHGWFLRAAPAEGALATVVHFHGNALNLTAHSSFVDWLPAAGYNVFLFDYRGYGRSRGEPQRAGIQLDGLAALDYVRSRDDVDPEKLLVFGQSLGGAVAIAAIGNGTPADRRGIRGVVAECSFSSYREIGNAFLGGTFLTWPLALLMVSGGYDAIDAVGKIAPIPLLIVHSADDGVIPQTHGIALFEAARAPRELWATETGGHAQHFTQLREEYRPRLLDYFERCIAPRSTAPSISGCSGHRRGRDGRPSRARPTPRR